MEIPVIQTFVKPQYYPKIKPECTNITMIRQKDVDGGMGFADLLEHLAGAYVPGEAWLACWGDSDQRVIDQACRRYKISCPFDWADYIDLAFEYRSFFGRERSIGLQQAVDETGVERYGMSHLAMDDAVNAARVMRHMMEGWLETWTGIFSLATAIFWQSREYQQVLMQRFHWEPSSANARLTDGLLQRLLPLALDNRPLICFPLRNRCFLIPATQLLL